MASSTYQMWYDRYMINAVNITTLNKLVTAGLLTQSEVDTMVHDREFPPEPTPITNEYKDYYDMVTKGVGIK